MTIPALHLFSTSGCHLCEEAEAMLQPLLRAGQVHLQVVEISRDDELVKKYGIRIPVLGGYDAGGGWRELGWPFDQAQVVWWSGQLSLMCQGS